MNNGDSFGSEIAGPSDSALRNTREPRNEESSSTTQGTQSVAGATSSDERTNPSGEDEQLVILKELESIVESFRSRKISKAKAIANVLGVLGKDTPISYSQSQTDATFDSYLTEILSIQSSFDRLGGHDETNETPATLESRTKKRAAREENRDESDSGEDDDQSHKRPKLVESNMPWFSSSEQPDSSSGNPNSQETCRLLRYYNRDISKAKFFIKIAPKSPSGIPSSQWERILKGDAVDLNQIFASLHNIVPDEERTGRLGDTEISFGVAEAKKRIRTASEWSSAWKRASKAICFAFPHQQEELSEYGDHIDSEFAAKVSSSHPKIILYDVALRNEVAGGQHYLLTDFNRFSRLYSAIVLPDGIEGHSDQPPGKKPSGSKPTPGKPEICNKFNSGTCKRADSECKYLHICKNCRKTGHGKKDCPDKSK